MRTGSILLGCLLAVSPVHSLPTVENFVKLAQRGSTSDELSELTKALQNINEKRLLLDPLNKPIDGETRFVVCPLKFFVLISKQCRGSTPLLPPTLITATREDHARV